MALNASGGSMLVPINGVTPPGQPPTAPWPLNDDGTQMASPTAVPELLTFYPYPQLAFSSLGFS